MPARPRDRKAQITAAAQDLFARDGYHGVGMAQIARAVGIGGSAMYRHFGGKQHLLAESVEDALAAVTARLDAAGSRAAVGDVVPALVTLALERRGLAIMWEREARHLDPPHRDAVAAHVARIENRLARSLPAAGSAADRGRSLTRTARGHAALAVVWSTSYHHVHLARPGFDDLVAGTALAVAGTAPHALVRWQPGPTDLTDIDDTPRERILAAASTLFAQRGFDGVGVSDIGASLGVTGPSTYRHFPAKATVLHTALMRAAQALHTDLRAADRDSPDPRHSLDDAVRGYVDVMHRHRGITRLLGTEVVSLPTDLRAEVVATQRRYVDHFATLVRRRHPQLTPGQSQVVLLAALAIVNDRFRRDAGPGSAGAALALARTALESGARVAEEVNRN